MQHRQPILSDVHVTMRFIEDLDSYEEEEEEKEVKSHIVQIIQLGAHTALVEGFTTSWSSNMATLTAAAHQRW